MTYDYTQAANRSGHRGIPTTPLIISLHEPMRVHAKRTQGPKGQTFGCPRDAGSRPNSKRRDPPERPSTTRATRPSEAGEPPTAASSQDSDRRVDEGGGRVTEARGSNHAEAGGSFKPRSLDRCQRAKSSNRTRGPRFSTGKRPRRAHRDHHRRRDIPPGARRAPVLQTLSTTGTVEAAGSLYATVSPNTCHH